MNGPPPIRRRAHSVPDGWSAATPADDPPPPAPARPERPRGATLPAPTRPAPPPAAAARPGPRPPDLTGRPRVDWNTYDAQAARDHTHDPEWVLYRCWTTVPVDGRWWARALEHATAWLVGPRRRLIYIGISMRAGIARAAEHLADKRWRRQIHIFEIDPTVTFSSETDAEAYEEARIRAEHPVYNIEHNDRADNPGATHLVRRIQARHVADWHTQAALLALLWVTLAAGCTWLLMPDTPSLAGVLQTTGGGFMLAATMLQALRIAGLFVRGNRLTSAQRRRIHVRIASRARGRVRA